MGSRYDAWLAQKEKERESLLIEARDLIAAGRFDEAERFVLQKDDSLETVARLALVYRECLRTAVATGARRAFVEAMLGRALAAAARSFPEPHTEFEADGYARGLAEAEGVLMRIAGR